MNRMMRILPVTLLFMPTPVAAEPAEKGVQTFPQPVVLEWGDQYRLYSPPKNVAASDPKGAAAAEAARPRKPAVATPSSRAAMTIGPDYRTNAQTGYARFPGDGTTLNIEAPVKSGPVSLGANYGKYRAVQDTRAVSAHDARVSLGVAF